MHLIIAATTIVVFFLQFFFNSFLETFIYAELLILFFLIANKKNSLAHYSAFGYGFLMDMVSHLTPFGIFAIFHIVFSMFLERTTKIFANLKDSKIAAFYIFTICIVYGLSIGAVLYIGINIFTSSETKIIQTINPKTILTYSLSTAIFAFFGISSKNIIKKTLGKWFFIK